RTRRGTGSSLRGCFWFLRQRRACLGRERVRRRGHFDAWRIGRYRPGRFFIFRQGLRNFRRLRRFVQRERRRGNRARLDRRRRGFVLRNFLRRRYRRGGDVLRRLEPADIVERIGKHHIERGRINLFRRNDPVVRFRGVVMFELPGRLRVVERRRIARELELLHHLLSAAVFALEK